VSDLRDQLARLAPAQVAPFLAGLPAEQLQALQFDWATWARPEQLPPDDGEWNTFLYLAGRGAGKTRSAAEWVRRMAKEHAGCRIAIVARTAADVRDVCIEGESGLLAVHPPSDRPLYEPSKRRITWRNGSQATAYSADEPDLLRGPQHHFAWGDELATWERLEEAWSNLRLGLRLGTRPRVVVTTTPRPLPLIRELLKSPSTVVRRGSTFDNAANLAPSALAEFRARYEGTRLGRQELYAELLEDAEGALWSHALLDATRAKVLPRLKRVVVGVDPSVTAGEGADECGIVVAGKGEDGQFYVLADLSAKLTPNEWARQVVRAFRTHRADRVVAEGNQGGALVEEVLRTVDRHLPVKRVHASRGKVARAEPVAAIFEQGRAHIFGSLPQLEDQLAGFTVEGYVGSGSPDRADAMVWALTELARGSAVELGPGPVLFGELEASQLPIALRTRPDHSGDRPTGHRRI
jgi:predicted phage terminase large subunit-like protein